MHEFNEQVLEERKKVREQLFGEIAEYKRVIEEKQSLIRSLEVADNELKKYLK